ncbi:GRTP1 [Cordylochernes scorpioides]|uniref:GRTP1 n=1 Tax=Cordylochernes scorpioides TaxID=51811 RepID=A0ABY6KSU3_9ARAC|nr:GRTP1 [Cordylochernes scorpioides]
MIARSLYYVNWWQVWCLVSGANDLKAENPGVYRQLLESPHDDDIMESIDTDIPRTFPDNIYFRNDPEGKCKNLKNVLVAFAHYDKSVGYCQQQYGWVQGLNFITGMLLLVTENEENAFWLLVCLVQHILPPGYYTSSMSGLLMDIEVFSLLLHKDIRSLIDGEKKHWHQLSIDVSILWYWGNREGFNHPILEVVQQQCLKWVLSRIKDPEVSEQLKKHDVPLNLVASKWFICLYADVLPIETLLRLWDCLFYEGSKVLFRAALCLVMVNRERILAAKSFVEIVEIFKGIGRDIFPTYCHEFMKVSTLFTLSSVGPMWKLS